MCVSLYICIYTVYRYVYILYMWVWVCIQDRKRYIYPILTNTKISTKSDMLLEKNLKYWLGNQVVTMRKLISEVGRTKNI